MFSEYIAAALARAEYEVIDNPEPYYAHVPGLEGVWATGETFEDCRKALIETIEEWIAIRLRHGLRIPSIDGNANKSLEEQKEGHSAPLCAIVL